MAHELRDTLYLQHRSSCHFFLGSAARISRHLSASVHVTQIAAQLLLSKPSSRSINTQGRNFCVKHLVYHPFCTMIGRCVFVLVVHSVMHTTRYNYTI